MSYDPKKWAESEVTLPKYGPYRRWVLLAVLIWLVFLTIATALNLLGLDNRPLISLVGMAPLLFLGPSAFQWFTKMGNPDEYHKQILGKAYIIGYYILFAFLAVLCLWFALADDLGRPSLRSFGDWLYLGLNVIAITVVLPLTIAEFLLPKATSNDLEEEN